MELDTVGFLVCVVGPGLIVAAAILHFIFPVRHAGDWDIRVGGHHDPVTGEFHGTTFHFTRPSELAWYADCPKCVADRDSTPVRVTEDDFPDLYESVRGIPSMVTPDSGMKREHESLPPVSSALARIINTL